LFLKLILERKGLIQSSKKYDLCRDLIDEL